MRSITIIKPDDWHLHLRDQTLMESVVNHTAKYFQRALVMPNLKVPIINIDQAIAYKKRILNSLEPDNSFQPLMTLYLTAETKPELIKKAKECEDLAAIKMYPAGATTHSSHGIREIRQADVVFEMMQKVDMPLSIHGEVVDDNVDIFDREKVFIDRILLPLTKRYPSLRIVLEHLTTREAVDFIRESPAHIAGTITVHHLLLNRNDLLVGGIKPHHYCLPIVKTEEDRLCLLEAATSGNSKFFLGTDSAPHLQTDKEDNSGNAGIYSAPVAMPLCIELFAKADRLDRIEGFCSVFGADFYGLSKNHQRLKFVSRETEIPGKYPSGDQWVVPLMAGKTASWCLDEGEN